MQIRISDLPIEGIEIHESFPPDELNAQLSSSTPSDADGGPSAGSEWAGILFTEPIEVRCRVRPSIEGAELTGTAKSAYRQPCGRCLQELPREVTVPLNFILKPNPLRRDGSPEFVDDLGIVYFLGEHVDLKPTIHESLILTLSLFWSPPLTTEGRCSACNLKPVAAQEPESSKMSLGDLLKKAGLN